MPSEGQKLSRTKCRQCRLNKQKVRKSSTDEPRHLYYPLLRMTFQFTFASSGFEELVHSWVLSVNLQNVSGPQKDVSDV